MSENDDVMTDEVKEQMKPQVGYGDCIMWRDVICDVT